MPERNTFITREGYEKLEKEIEELKTVKRKEIASRIQEAKELGDLSENAEYQDAKNEQAFVEGRIAELETLLRQATIISKHQASNVVSVGSTITIRMDGGTKEYMIVGSKEADPTSGKISNESPFGRSFIGKRVGDVAEIETPRGKRTVEIVASR